MENPGNSLVVQMTSPQQRDSESPPRTPRWVKVFGIIILVVVLLFVILKFIGGGRHGPGRHRPTGDTAGQTPAGRN